MSFFKKHVVACLIALVTITLTGFALFTLNQKDPWVKATQWTLENGLTVVHIQNTRAPIVHASIWYKTGGAYDPDGKAGLAHYLEHLMFRPPINKPDQNFSEIVKNWGGDNNAFTSYDVTAYFAQLPAARLMDYLVLESERMAKLAPDPTDAKTELSVIGQERQQTVESEPRRVFSEAFNRQFMPNHAYGRSLIGLPADIKGLTLDDAKAFHTRYYAPNNAVLVLAGDVTEQDAKVLVHDVFGAIPARVTTNESISEPKYGLNKEFIACDARVQQPSVSITYPLPPAYKNKDIEMAAQTLAHILAADPSTPFYRAVIDDKKLVSAYDVSYDTNMREHADMTFSLWLNPEKTDKRQVIHDFIAQINTHSQAITRQDTDAATAQLQLQYDTATDSLSGTAMTAGYAMGLGKSLDEIRHEPDELGNVTRDGVMRVVDRYIAGQTPYKAILLPAGDPLCP